MSGNGSQRRRAKRRTTNPAYIAKVPKKLARSTIEAYAGIAIAIILAVFPMTWWWLRITLLLGLAWIVLDLAWRSAWTIKLRTFWKLTIVVSAWGLICWFGGTVVYEQYLVETFKADKNYVMSWGPSGPGWIIPGNPPTLVGAKSSEVIADGSLLMPYRKKFKVMAVCFHNRLTGDVLDIANISKSGPYDIEDRPIRITIPWNDEFVKDFASGWTGTGYDLLLVPPGLTPDRFGTVRQALALGAKRIKRVSGPP